MEVGQSAEKRMKKRIYKKVEVSLIKDAERFQADALDISPCGLRIRSNLPQAVGEMVEVELNGPAEKIRLSASVSWQRQYSGIEGKTCNESGLSLTSEYPDLPDFLFTFKGRPLSTYLDRLSTLPTVILDLMAMLNDARVSLTEITRKVSTDQVLVAYLLKVINSPLYGFYNPINSISQCCSLLGFSNLKSLLLTYFTRQLNFSAGKKALREKLWRHALVSALLARECAKWNKLSDEESYIAALLHDIGKPVMIMLDEVLFVEAQVAADWHDPSRLQAEQSLFGFSHDILAGYLMGKWNLGTTYCESGTFHHRSEEYQGTDPLVWNTVLANALANARFGDGGSVAETCWTKAGVPAAQEEPIVKAVAEQIETMI